MNESMSLVHLHSDNFQICRICMSKPESNRQIKFYNIFSPGEEEIKLKSLIWSHLGVQIDEKDIKPKIICHNCYTTVLSADKLKKKAHESQIILNYLVKEKYNGAPAITPRILASPEINEATISYINRPTIIHVESISNTQDYQNETDDNSDYQRITTDDNSDYQRITTDDNSDYQRIMTDDNSDYQRITTDDNSDYQRITTDDDEVTWISDNESSESIHINDIKDCTNQAEAAVTPTLSGVKLEEAEKNIFIGTRRNTSEVTHTPTMEKQKYSNCLCQICGIVIRSPGGFSQHIKIHSARFL